ncbi:MAG: hypothetical protein B7733_20745 [Myxococcales bacterium FL481]|nr:MAG: hypothetical protein B7733_20745 [Myxococcales bacterium FL481]
MRSSRGMALMEVLVATAILGMMVASIWSSFSVTVRGMERTEVVQQRYAGVRLALSRMTSELAMAYLSFNRPADENRAFTLLEGRNDFESDMVTFSSFAHLRIRKDSNESDQTVIQYFLSPSADGSEQHLFRRESRRLAGDRPEDLGDFVPAYILCENVASLNVKYWDVKEEEWRDDWSTLSNDAQPDRLPKRIMIDLGIRDEDGEIEHFFAQTELFLQEKIDLARG